MIIIGIAGMFGAGKGTVARYLVDRKGFEHYEMSGFITEEVIRRGLLVNRDSMIAVANDLRAEFGAAYIVESLYSRAVASGGNAVIESLRALGEVRRIRGLGGFVIGVDANQRIRYDRVRGRKSVKDNISFEKFAEQERLEMNAGDSFKQDLRGVLQESDIVLTNDGTVEDLYEQIEMALIEIARA